MMNGAAINGMGKGVVQSCFVSHQIDLDTYFLSLSLFTFLLLVKYLF